MNFYSYFQHSLLDLDEIYCKRSAHNAAEQWSFVQMGARKI